MTIHGNEKFGTYWIDIIYTSDFEILFEYSIKENKFYLMEYRIEKDNGIESQLYKKTLLDKKSLLDARYSYFLLKDKIDEFKKKVTAIRQIKVIKREAGL